MMNMLTIELQTADVAAASKVDAYVNRPTQTGSAEQAIAGLVRAAVRTAIDHYNGGHYTDDIVAERETRANAWADAAALVTSHELTPLDIIQAARLYAHNER